MSNEPTIPGVIKRVAARLTGAQSARCANAVLFLVTVAVCLLIAEVVLARFGPVPLSNSHLHRIPHPVYGWVLEPGASYQYALPEKVVSVRYNQAGWRDKEHTQHKPAHIYRVLILGDSFMEGYTVNLEDAFHRQLLATGRVPGRVQTINLGVGGYGTLQQYRVLRDIGVAYKPDLVLLGFYLGNDVQNNDRLIEAMVNPGSVKVDSRPFLRAADSPQSTDWQVDQSDYEGAMRRFREARPGWLVRRFALARYVVNARRNVYEGVARLVSRTGEPHSAESSTVQAVGTAPTAPTNPSDQRRMLVQHSLHYCEEAADFTRAWTTTRRILARIKALASEAGAPLVVFSVPSRFEVSREEWQQAPDAAQVCWDAPPGYQRLAQQLQDLDVPFINLLTVFRQASQDGTELFRLSDRHWNEAGHALAARHVRAQLDSRGLLAGRNLPR